MPDSDFSLLVELVGTLRDADARPGMEATIEIKGSVDSSRRIYLVEVRVQEAKYRSIRSDELSQFEIIYDSVRHETLIIESSDSHFVRDDEWRIPVAAPELAMFRPLDLPIWGGATDTHRITSISRGGENEFILGITMIGDDGEEGEECEVVINNDLCYVIRMEWNYETYSVQGLKVSKTDDIWSSFP